MHCRAIADRSSRRTRAYSKDSIEPSTRTPNNMTQAAQDDALIIVDVQRDFLPGGALAVPSGDAVIPVLNRYIDVFGQKGLPIFATRDWHPAGHCSFREQGGPWPPHCVAGTRGAEFPSTLQLTLATETVSKGVIPHAQGYSGFELTGLAWRLRSLGRKRLFVGGLATDYCVRATVLDALREGFEVVVLQDGVRSVDVQAGDGVRALEEVRAQGAKIAIGSG
jgi:nicotinamidase/pyrazinamidase